MIHPYKGTLDYYNRCLSELFPDSSHEIRKLPIVLYIEIVVLTTTLFFIPLKS